MRKYLAELIGTFILVFCGTGAIIINQQTGGAVSHVGIAMTFGLVVLSMIYAIGDISGAHMNPAVTIAFTVAGRLEKKLSLYYILFQVMGALLASALLKLLFPEDQTLGSTMPAGSLMQSFVIETVLTFILMFVILNVSSGAKEKGITAGIAVASVVGLEAMFAGPISGASMNPARSLAPAVVSGSMNALWIYLIAPVAGALLSVIIYKVIKVEPTK